jgi:peptidoglycan-associated lipoprotein
MKMIRFSAITLSLLLITIILPAQKRTFKKADEAFKTGEYHVAYELYEQSYEKLTDKAEKAEIAFKMAECSRIMMNDKDAKKWYSRAVRYNVSKPLAYLYYADALKMAGEYEEAKVNYKKYQNMVPDDLRGKIGEESCDLALEWMQNPTRYIVTEEVDINSKNADFSPSFGKSRSEIYFTSSRESANGKNINGITGEGFSDIFITVKDRKGQWSVPVPVEGSVNTEGDEGAGVVINEGSTMYFTVCKRTEGANLGCKIYKSKSTVDGWSSPEMIELQGDSTVSYAHPAVSKDEMTMYFVSDSVPGQKGKGGKDIWVVKRSSPSGAWGSPENLGPKINSKGDEKFPFVAADGSLYFASDGHQGMGGFDIFKAYKNGTVWEVENMKYPVNSSKNDFGICFYDNDKFGYFCSDRNKDINLFNCEMPDMLFVLRGKVINSNNQQPLPDALVQLTSPSGHELEINSASDGTFRFNLRPKTDYSVIGSKSKFLSAIADLSTKGLIESKEFDIILDLSPIETRIELPNIEYDFGKITLREESMVSLDELIKTLTLNSHITIELSANTDFRGSNESNQTLSEGRAKSVVDYLISKGIKEDRLTAVGNGEQLPKKIDAGTKYGRNILSTYKFLKNGDVLTEDYINALETEEQKEICHQLNRRTEFRVLRDDYGINAVKFGGEEE